MTDSTEPDSDSETEPGDTTEHVERSFTCTVCGYATVHEVDQLRATVQATCLNCGDWTTQSAQIEDVIESAETVAEEVAGTVITDRQALAVLLRDVVGIDRQTAADAMETTPSNADNLQRRGREKIQDARKLVERLDAVVRAQGESQ